MSVKTNLDKASLRVLQYDLVDGTYELFFAAFYLAGAAILYAQAVAPHSIWTDLLAGPGLLLILPGGAFLLDRLIQRLRERITYPRIGYIARKPAPESSPRFRRLVWIGVPVLVLAVLTLLSFYRPVLFPAGSSEWEESVPVFPAFFALIMGGLWVILAWKLRLPRFYLIALLTWLTGIAIFLARLSNAVGSAAFCAAMALILGVTGLFTLLVYLRRNPGPLEKSQSDE
jgi:hypothetical protein